MARKPTTVEIPEDAGPQPRTTVDLFGHAQAERRFLEAWTRGASHHAWMITGPEGIGKASFAYRIARFVLSQGGGPEPDGLFGAPPPPTTLAISPEHPAFRKIAAGSHPDLLSIEREMDDKKGKQKRDIAVAQIREVTDFLHLTPGEGGWRVVIVDPVDDLNTNAANALLKILEEPPPNVLILLISHQPGALLPTIRSRCRRIDLQPLSQADMLAALAALDVELPARSLSALSAIAEGSPGRALALSEGGGLTMMESMLALVARAPDMDAAQIHAFADKLSRAAADADYALFTELYSWWLVRVMRGQARGDLAEILPGEGAAIRAITERVGLERTLEVWDKSKRSFAQAAGLNLDRKQVVLDAFAAFAS